MPVYRVIYDVRDAFDATSFLMMALFGAMGLSLWAVGRADGWLLSRAGAVPGGLEQAPGFADQAVRMRRWGMLLLVCGPLILGLMGWMEWSVHQRLGRALESGAYTVVEGPIVDFRRGDAWRRRDERFSIVSNGRRHTYEYSGSRSVPGFHESQGPIREGMHLRIADVRGAIARLEVRTVEDPATYRLDAERSR